MVSWIGKIGSGCPRDVWPWLQERNRVRQLVLWSKLCKHRHVLSPSFSVVGVQGGSSSDSGLYSKKFPEHLKWEGLAPRLLTELLFSEFSPIPFWCMGLSQSQDLGFYRKSSSLPPGPLCPATYASLQHGTQLPSASPGSVIQVRAKWNHRPLRTYPALEHRRRHLFLCFWIQITKFTVQWEKRS